MRRHIPAPTNLRGRPPTRQQRATTMEEHVFGESRDNSEVPIEFLVGTNSVQRHRQRTQQRAAAAAAFPRPPPARPRTPVQSDIRPRFMISSHPQQQSNIEFTILGIQFGGSDDSGDDEGMQDALMREANELEQRECMAKYNSPEEREKREKQKREVEERIPITADEAMNRKNKIVEAVTCPVCLVNVSDTLLTKCGHLICSTCLVHIQNPLCAVCQCKFDQCRDLCHIFPLANLLLPE